MLMLEKAAKHICLVQTFQAVLSSLIHRGAGVTADRHSNKSGPTRDNWLGQDQN